MKGRKRTKPRYGWRVTFYTFDGKRSHTRDYSTAEREKMSHEEMAWHDSTPMAARMLNAWRTSKFRVLYEDGTVAR